MLSLEQSNKEQIRRMQLYRLSQSKKLGYDIGETGYFAWVEKYSAKYRAWIERQGETGLIDFVEDDITAQ